MVTIDIVEVLTVPLQKTITTMNDHNINLVSISGYAKMCGVSRQVIHKRIKAGRIYVTLVGKRPHIDIDAYPVEANGNWGKGGRPVDK